MSDFGKFYETVVQPAVEAVPPENASENGGGYVDRQRILMSNLLKGVSGFVCTVEPRIRFQPILVSIYDPEETIWGLSASKFLGDVIRDDEGKKKQSNYKYIFSLQARKVLTGIGCCKTELCRIMPKKNGDVYPPQRTVFEIQDSVEISREQAMALYATLMRRVRSAFPRLQSVGSNGGISAPSA